METTRRDSLVLWSVVGIGVLVTIGIIYGVQKFKHQRERDMLQTVIRAELDRTFVILPDGSKVYLETEGARR
jgi:hypothetical protein